jgi:hypothetical protein
MPGTLAANASDEAIIDLIDQWVELLEQEKFEEALIFLETEPFWTADLIKEIISEYGSAVNDRVTLYNNGTRLDGDGRIHVAEQRKEVEWYDEERAKDVSWSDKSRGDVWYDLNVNGMVSDLTATFDLERRDGRIHVILQDIHVM